MYSITKLFTVALQDPDIVEIEYNTRGKYSGTKIEKKFDVPIGFPNKGGYFPYPMCSVIKFKLNPANQKNFYSEGKPTVLMRYTLSQDYTLQNGPGKVFHKFTNSSLPNHTHCFFDRQNTALDRNRTNPIYVYQYCNLPQYTCQVQQPPPPNQPPTNPISSQSGDGGQTQNKGGAQSGDGGQTQNKGGAQGGDGGQTQNKGGAQGGDGGQPKTKEVPKVGTGKNPQISKVPNVGTGDKPKTNKVPKVGVGGSPNGSHGGTPTKKRKI